MSGFRNQQKGTQTIQNQCVNASVRPLRSADEDGDDDDDDGHEDDDDDDDADADFDNKAHDDDEDEEEEEEDETSKLPMPGNWIHPRLFVINNDDTGFEILSELQLKSFFSLAKGN